MRKDERFKALDHAISQIERQYGIGSIVRGGGTPVHEAPVMSTRSIGLDLAPEIGGIPNLWEGEIVGPESSGKITLALRVTDVVVLVVGQPAGLPVDADARRPVCM